MRSAKLEISILAALNGFAMALPLGPIGTDDEERAVALFAYGGTIAIVAALMGLAFAVGFGLRHQKWPAYACAILAITPFMLTVTVAQGYADFVRWWY